MEREKRKRSPYWTALLLLVVLASGTAAGVMAYLFSALQPQPAADEDIEVNIAPGMASGDIARLLEEKGLVRSGPVLQLYFKYKHQGSRFQAGVYRMKRGLTPDEIIARLNNGETLKEEVIRFTIPEGFTVEQIADKLSELKLADRQQFLDLADGNEAWSAAWTALVPQDKQIRRRLEGYFFAETYEFKKTSTVKEIIQRMLKELDRKLDTLPPDWRDKLKEKDWTVHQMLTVASLVEREVAVEEERPLVAGVIYNRLKGNMPLQIDATVQYSLERPKERLYNVDLRVESPYNTYLHTGLPPGPIASPGLNSIKAAIYPTETKYLFYVTKKDGSKTHLFAETFEQHQQNIANSVKK